MVFDRKLNATIAVQPQNVTTMNVVASCRISGGVRITTSSHGVMVVATAVSSTAAAAVRMAPAATERRTPRSSRAPKACAVGMAKPDDMPHVNPSSRNCSPPVEPTAASASTPMVRPTTKASAKP